MATPSKTLIALETKFWQSMVDEDTDTAVKMLAEPAPMVSAHGAMKFDHDAYRRMAEQGSNVLTSFELSDMDVTFANDDTAIPSLSGQTGCRHAWQRRSHGAADERQLHLDQGRQAVEVRLAHRNADRRGLTA